MKKIPKNPPKKKKNHWEHISRFSKVTAYKINIEKTVAFLFPTNEPGDTKIKNSSKQNI